MTSIEINQTTEDETVEEPELTHWWHPTDSTLYWCGAPRSPGFISQELAPKGHQKSCPLCGDLDRRFGWDWWWDTHRRYFESQCHSHQGWSFHNCIGS